MAIENLESDKDPRYTYLFNRYITLDAEGRTAFKDWDEMINDSQSMK